MEPGIVVIVVTAIVCVTVVLFRAISLPVALQRLETKLERTLARMEMKEAKHEDKQETKQDRIENRA